MPTGLTMGLGPSHFSVPRMPTALRNDDLALTFSSPPG